MDFKALLRWFDRFSKAHTFDWKTPDKVKGDYHYHNCLDCGFTVKTQNGHLPDTEKLEKHLKSCPDPMGSITFRYSRRDRAAK